VTVAPMALGGCTSSAHGGVSGFLVVMVCDSRWFSGRFVGDGAHFCGGASGGLWWGIRIWVGILNQNWIWSFNAFWFGDQGQTLSLYVSGSLTYLLCPSP